MNGGQSEVEKLALKYDLSYDKHVSTTWLYAFRLNQECFWKKEICNERGVASVVD